MNKYIPPFEISNKMLNYISEITEKITRLEDYNTLNRMPILRKNNRIRSIHSSLAIEANSLSLEQVEDVINERYVIGDHKEIQEVKNAYIAYEEIDNINPYSIEELKKVHGIMAYLIISNAGVFRNNAEGVFDGDVCIFMAPSERIVPELMDNLFSWLNNQKDELHPLILSSIFHYEFLFIHPFTDGNGRMARLWQNAILTKWNNIFKYVPIENQIKKYQDEYYSVISNSHINGNSNEFIEFMLKMINETLEELVRTSGNNNQYISVYVKKLLDVMQIDVPLTAFEIMEKLNLKSKENLRKNYLGPAIEAGYIKLSLPDKPTSKNQKYYKTTLNNKYSQIDESIIKEDKEIYITKNQYGTMVMMSLEKYEKMMKEIKIKNSR